MIRIVSGDFEWLLKYFFLPVKQVLKKLNTITSTEAIEKKIDNISTFLLRFDAPMGTVFIVVFVYGTRMLTWSPSPCLTLPSWSSSVGGDATPNHQKASKFSRIWQNNFIAKNYLAGEHNLNGPARFTVEPHITLVRLGLLEQNRFWAAHSLEQAEWPISPT